MRHAPHKEHVNELDEFELAKLRAQDAAITAFKKSIRWFFISFFVITILASFIIWLKSFHI
jgi:hypothetical protein